MSSIIARLPPRLRIYLRQRFKPRIVELDGFRLDVNHEAVTRDVRKFIYRETHENEERTLLGKHLRAEDTVLEMGGGIGVVSLACAKTCGADRVLTFEPNEKACSVIRRNFELNGMTPQLEQAAIATHDGAMAFHLHDNILSSSVIERDGTSASEVPCRDVSKVLAEFMPTVIVMDIEGAEEDILPLVAAPTVRGMLVELHPHIIGVKHMPGLIGRMEELGYTITDREGGKVVWFERISTQ